MAEGELWYSIETIAQAWANGTANHGLMVRAVAESGGNNWRQYLSGNYPETAPDGSHHPYFFVEYEAPAPPKVDGFTFMSPDPITSLPTYEEARARSMDEPTGGEQTTITNTFAGQIAGQRDGRDRHRRARHCRGCLAVRGVLPSTSEGYNACHRDDVRWAHGYKRPWFPSSWGNGQPHYELWLLY
jgi:hypothetical protein